MIAGMDIGSTAIKLVLWEDGVMVHSHVVDTTSDPLGVCRRLLGAAPYDHLVATGYGRHLLKEHFPEADVISEIKAVALGAWHDRPDVRTVIDIGGQDTKAIAVDETGRAAKFVMNDRCAAGTGQFLDMMATALALTRNQFVEAARRATRAENLSSMCSVFAQSEVVSMIAKGAGKEDIALGVHQSVARRTASLAGGIPLADPVLFTGGGARNPALAKCLSEALKRPVVVPDKPQTLTALGCALHGAAR